MLYISVVPQIPELQHVFNGFIHYLYVVILFHVLPTGHEQYFSIYFYTKPLFLYGKVYSKKTLHEILRLINSVRTYRYVE